MNLPTDEPEASAARYAVVIAAGKRRGSRIPSRILRGPPSLPCSYLCPFCPISVALPYSSSVQSTAPSDCRWP